jgi:hypothetical protein
MAKPFKMMNREIVPLAIRASCYDFHNAKIEVAKIKFPVFFAKI